MRILVGLATGTLLAIAIGSCWVDRRTSDFACTSDADCTAFSDPTRRCDTSLGYCVPGDNNTGTCPDVCNGGCDKDAHTCTVNCTAVTNCNGPITCPAGWDCTINCASSSCDAVRCATGADCTINCIGGSACGNIECGDGRCDVVCSGGSACDNVDCNSARCTVMCSGANGCNDVDCDTACRCDVSCASPSSCGTVGCLAPACELGDGCSAGQASCPSTCP